MVGSQTSENESIVEHPTQLLKRQNHISYLHGFYTTDEQTSLMKMINEMRQQRDVHEYVSAMRKIREIVETFKLVLSFVSLNIVSSCYHLYHCS